jgi:hypothetical protein
MTTFVYQTHVKIIYRHSTHDCVVGVMVSILTSSGVDCGFDPGSGQIKDYEIGICFFSAKYSAFRSKQRQDNVSEWSDMSISGLLFQ